MAKLPSVWGRGLVALIVTLGMAHAQELVVPEKLTQGQDTEIAYLDPDRPNERVEIEIESLTGDWVRLTVELDENGKGCAPWTVKGWAMARFHAPGTPPVSRFIQLPLP